MDAGECVDGWETGRTMDASPNGCKWVCGWVDVEERPTHKELTGLSGWDAGNWLKSVDGWENNGCKRTMDASERVGRQWMLVRMGASGWRGWVASLEILSHEAMIESRAQVVDGSR